MGAAQICWGALEPVAGTDHTHWTDVARKRTLWFGGAPSVSKGMDSGLHWLEKDVRTQAQYHPGRGGGGAVQLVYRCGLASRVPRTPGLTPAWLRSKV